MREELTSIHEPSFDDCSQHLAASHKPVRFSGLVGSDRAFFLARLFLKKQQTFLVVCPTEKQANGLARDLEFFLEQLSGEKSNEDQGQVLVFPAYHVLAFKNLTLDPDTVFSRIRALWALLSNERPRLVVISAEAAMGRIIPSQVLNDSAELVLAGEDLDREDFLQKLTSSGYASTLVVESPGEFSVRGGIVDVFAPPLDQPLRLEFFGDTVESIRQFSITSQRTVKNLDEAVILPATEAVVDSGEISGLVHRARRQALESGMRVTQVRELVGRIKQEGRFPGMESMLSLVYDECATIFDYLPAGASVFQVEPGEIQKAADGFWDKVTGNYEQALEDQRLCLGPESTHLPPQSLSAFFRETEGSRKTSLLTLLPQTGQNEEEPGGHFRVEDVKSLTRDLALVKERTSPLKPLVDWVWQQRDQGRSIVMVCRGREKARRLDQLLAPYGIRPRFAPDPFGEDSQPGSISLVSGDLSAGFVWPGKNLALITDAEIFGIRRKRVKTERPRPKTELLDLAGLRQNDLVVHIEHGIGQYEGLVKLTAGGVSNDFVSIAFKDNDRLYVPVDRTHLVQKYRGLADAAPPLDKLGGKSWERIKKKVKRTVEKIAGELLKLYATRRVRKGYAFSEPDKYFQQFEAAFPYEETPDQAKAISQVLADMEKEEPMDRLVCGDVGYGKTEVALRASFKAVSDSKQVAFLAPTTILCEQHYSTFRERFSGYPIQVACLNRFRSPAEAKKILLDLKEGRVDVVIGTHRLLQKDVAFKDLSLVIIDEEQRFGVRHKERLKQFRATVDMLALTATPIPRTLHMSLAGIRDISVINTPPESRRPITTYITPFQDAVVAEAIEREMARDGQVFFVHNRVKTIWAKANHIKKLVPDARVAVAHGQLSEEELEKVMLQFVHEEVDVLVCTTIIESGLDIPAANTIIIDRADMFGLAQMYQLRGRVGRGEEQAFAYLFIPDESILSRDAQRRLKVLMEHSDLGAGFQIAMSDLQIRGGGTILGSSQSGHVAAVGYELYLELMETAVREIKGEKEPPPLDPEINVDYSAYFPGEYVPDTDQRLSAYRRAGRFSQPGEVGTFKKEITDRFGPPPRQANQFFYKIMLKTWCKKAGIKKLDLAGTLLRAAMSEEHLARPEGLAELVRKNPSKFTLTPEGLFTARLSNGSVRARTSAAKNVLKEIVGHVN